jgi:alkyldihydroxyacetonephosphate synthase
VSIDLRALDRVLEVDPVSRAARIQAGALGPSLEKQLAEHGLTLRHYPQSFELSSLGGWIATRAGSHFATLYTHIGERAVRGGAAGGQARARPRGGDEPGVLVVVLGALTGFPQHSSRARFADMEV